MTPASSADSPPISLPYRFRNRALLDEALTHKSYVNENRDKHVRHNERLEFLGDAVLSLIISEYLATRYPELREGALSKLKADLVSESSLAAAARRLDLGAHLKMGRGEERSMGRKKPSLLADGLEAVIAAVYLDGGIKASRTFVLETLAEELRKMESMQTSPGRGDYKTRLQEWCQKRHKFVPRYHTLRETGPDHQKLFQVEVSVGDETLGVGQGSSKKEAEQEAARRALERIER
ncbi:MAG: ribonuclease III [Nitrospira sp.]|nr:ribonuclease III [Nitrospira sp.]